MYFYVAIIMKLYFTKSLKSQCIVNVIDSLIYRYYNVNPIANSYAGNWYNVIY